MDQPLVEEFEGGCLGFAFNLLPVLAAVAFPCRDFFVAASASPAVRVRACFARQELARCFASFEGLGSEVRTGARLLRSYYRDASFDDVLCLLRRRRGSSLAATFQNMLNEGSLISTTMDQLYLETSLDLPNQNSQIDICDDDSKDIWGEDDVSFVDDKDSSDSFVLNREWERRQSQFHTISFYFFLNAGCSVIDIISFHKFM
ncbi:hypothetical protein IEQ34_011873 [Dendrobium chrysotoxum]|uniref:Uncharacterized protein n=1 Tax=Dendrobium chrysotoxum TaxID=161865 RepID=A0AAV7GBA3_DENCH|nr:hypothetical protein IEQ34_011873 [Dendrobium chrysotoxum]